MDAVWSSTRGSLPLVVLVVAFTVVAPLGASPGPGQGYQRTTPRTSPGLVLASGFVLAATPTKRSLGQQPPRDADAGRHASGAIRGRVIGPGRTPLRRVILTLRSPSLARPLQTTTDLDGRFEFVGLGEGRYRLTGAKGTFVATEYGQRRAGRPGTELALVDGQAIQDVTLVLAPGGSVSGSVVDDLGEPAAFVRVSALKRVVREGRAQLEAVGRAVETNDLGQFRLFGLAPGSYVVGASGVVWAPGSASVPEAPSSAPTFYPGTAVVAEAIRLTLATGEDRTGVNIPLLPIRPARVSGTAFDSAGKPATSLILASLDPVGGVAATGTMGATSSASVKADGSFSMDNVAPGDYMLSAYSRDTESGDVESAAFRLSVIGGDISGLSIATTAGAKLRGKFITDPTQPGPARSSVHLFTEPVGDGFAGSLAGQATIAADWSFELPGVAGRRRLRVDLPAGWMLKSIALDGVDITEAPIDAPDHGELTGLQIALTNHISVIAGSVADADGKLQRDYWVVAFPPEPSQWTPRSRRLQSARPDQLGRFSLSALPAGEYLVAAVDDLEDGEASDPEFLESLRAKATPITIGDGEQKTVDLRIIARTHDPRF